jgi:hypothetical protein
MAHRGPRFTLRSERFDNCDDLGDLSFRPLHRDYRARFCLDCYGKTFEGSAGDIFVIKAGETHSFKAVGDSPLVQVDVHLSPRFIQENL